MTFLARHQAFNMGMSIMTTNATAVLQENFVSCRDIHKLNSSQWCSFINETDSCKIIDGFIDYTHFVYCEFNRGMAMFILTLWLVFLFIAMAVCADDFFCPPLVAIAKLLKMSDNVAGVTLLAFGNGAADVFSSIAAVKTAQGGDVGLAIGALLGAGILLATIVAGSVCIITPCHMAERPFLRDVIFFLLSVFMVFYVLFDKKVTLLESVGFLATYFVYAALVVIGRWVYQKVKKSRELTSAVYEDQSDNSPSYSDVEGEQNIDYNESIDTEETPLIGHGNSSITPLQEFIIVISPINFSDFKHSKWFFKIYMILKAPAMLILNIAIPIVDYQKPKHGWNRHLNALHCTLSPLLSILVADPSAFHYYIGGKFPVYGLILLLGPLISVLVYCTSNSDTPPVYHIVFAFIGFVASVVWTDAIATELVNILTTTGIVINISNAILGLTLLAWGNSVADFIADIVMARKGYPRAALSACYGGPLFNILLGIGVPFTVAVLGHGTKAVDFTLIQVILVSGLMVILALTLIIVPVMKFVLGKKFGIFLFLFYVVFLVIILLAEFNVIKAKF